MLLGTETVITNISAFDPGTFPPGTTNRVWLHVFDLLTSPLLLPAFVVNGASPGRTLFTVAGVHGDEYEGMVAIRRIVARLDPARMRGRLIAIPVANPLAYEARARVAPLHHDGLNLARVFPGDPSGSPSRMLASALLDLVQRCVGPDDLFLDFHSGSADVTFATVIGFRGVPGEHTVRAEAAARCFGLERIWLIPDSPGPINAETARRGIVTLGTETTGRAGCDPEDVAVYEQGLWNLLAYLGVVQPAESNAPTNAPVRASVDVLAPATGFFNAERQLYDEVEQGDLLGTIVDLFGDPIAPVYAPRAGELWASRTMPPVRTGELIATIAQR
jgi:predicted deacylase